MSSGSCTAASSGRCRVSLLTDELAFSGIGFGFGTEIQVCDRKISDFPAGADQIRSGGPRTTVRVERRLSTDGRGHGGPLGSRAA